MDELEKKVPDDFWRKAFEEAAETPPPRVWSTIERRLDESDGPKVLPLWGTGLASSRPLMWASGLAAAVALLLVGWWAIHTQPATQSVAHQSIAQKPSVNNADRMAASRPIPSTDATTATTRSAGQTENSPSIKSVTAGKSLPTEGDLAAAVHRQSLSPIERSANAMAQETVKAAGNTLTVPQPNVSSRSSSLAVSSVQESGAQSRMAAASYASVPDVQTSAFSKNASVAYEQLRGKPMRLRKLPAIQRIVWVRPAEPMAEPAAAKSKTKTRDMWASVSMMPGAFNPAVSVRAVQPSLANSFYNNTTYSNTAALSNTSGLSSSVNSRANFSVAFQAGAGVQVTDRWSVESGIGYLSGRSTVETPSQQPLASIQMDIIANRNTGGNNTLYIDALRNSVQTSKAVAGGVQNGYTTAAAMGYRSLAYSSQQSLTNDYQFVQVPVQVGYQLRPRKRLSMAVLGGLITNIFVRNTVGDELVVTAKDGVYRPVSLAAIMGARFRYRPSRRWSASLAGIYQPSLESTTKADAQVESRPTSAGMSFGVDYHF